VRRRLPFDAVQVDVLTGDRRVLRADIMFDLGRPVNPAVDLGQVRTARTARDA
jgi:xanthine dehydrogenase molybdopterin-binding subunit B